MVTFYVSRMALFFPFCIMKRNVLINELIEVRLSPFKETRLSKERTMSGMWIWQYVVVPGRGANNVHEGVGLVKALEVGGSWSPGQGAGVAPSRGARPEGPICLAAQLTVRTDQEACLGETTRQDGQAKHAIGLCRVQSKLIPRAVLSGCSLLTW